VSERDAVLLDECAQRFRLLKLCLKRVVLSRAPA
jgi:hypothetical protein